MLHSNKQFSTAKFGESLDGNRHLIQSVKNNPATVIKGEETRQLAPERSSKVFQNKLITRVLTAVLPNFSGGSF